MFGLGHYIYAGEDLPKVVTKQLTDDQIILAVGEASSIKDLTDLWNANKPISAAVSKVFETKKKQFVLVK
jgi:Protein of unknown function (DUF1071).